MGLTLLIFTYRNIFNVVNENIYREMEINAFNLFDILSNISKY